MNLQLVNYNKSIAGFTDDQKVASDGIIDFIANPFDATKYIVGLTGEGGTGKTYITNYIITNCIYSDSVIKCTSPTHKACRVFSQALNGKNVDTIQSILGLKLDLNLEDFNPANPQFNPKSKPKLDNTRVLIVDEASMLPAKLVTYICNECKSKSIKLIFIGDSSQLPPVNETKSIAFARCFKVYELKQVVRQETNNSIRVLLNLLRQDITNKTYSFMSYVNANKNTEDINDNNEGFIICNSNEFKALIDKSFSNKEYTSNIDMYKIVAYTNTCVTSWNNYIRNTIIKDADKNIITKNDLIMSYKTIVDDFLSVVINNSEEYIIKDIVNYTDNTYNFKGFLVKFQLVHGGFVTSPLFIIDHRDKYTITMYHKTITELINAAKSAVGKNRISKWKDYYEFKKKYLLATNILSANGRIIHDRDIDYGFAITSHKSQGSTYDYVFVDLNNMLYNSTGKLYAYTDELLRRIYVACSRAKKQLILRYD